MSNRINDEVYAILAAHVYNDARGPLNLLDLGGLGWVKLPESVSNMESDPLSNGFSASAYQKGDQIVIAFKGTDFLIGVNDGQTISDISTDIRLGLGFGSAQLTAAVLFYQKIKATYLNTENPNIEISFTGHSLGAGLASLVSVLVNEPAVVFANAPFAASIANLGVIQGLIDNPLITDPGIRNTLDQLLIRQDNPPTGIPGQPTQTLFRNDVVFNAREANVASHYVSGEVLNKYFADTLFVNGSNTPIQVGNHEAGAIDLHSIVLHAALTLEENFRLSTVQLPTLLSHVFDTNLYARNLALNDQDFLTHLLKDQVNLGVNHNNGMLHQFALDALKINGEVALNNSAFNQALITALIEDYYFMDNGFTQSFYEVSGGGIGFDFNHINSSNRLSDALLLAGLQSVMGSDYAKVNISGVLDYKWYVKTSDGVIEANVINNQAVFMLGSSSADVLVGAGGNDVLYGGAGNDVLNGGLGNDTLIGGEGVDTYIFNSGDHDTIIDSDGKGWIKYRDADGAIQQVTLAGAFIAATQQGNQWQFTLPGGGVATLSHNSPWRITMPDGSILELGEDFEDGDFGIRLFDDNAAQATYDREIRGDLTPLNTTSTDELGNLIVTATDEPGRADVLYGSAQNDHILGLAGDDHIEDFRGGDDKLDGGAGNDQILAGEGDDILIGGDGQDRLFGHSGDDYLYAQQEISLEDALILNQSQQASGLKGDFLDGGLGDDVVIGDAGNDFLNGSHGHDVLIGGGGDDNMYGDGLATNVQTGWSVGRWMTTDQDGNHYEHQFANFGFQSSQEGGNDLMYGGAGDDWMFGGVGNDYLDGGTGNDVLFGEAGSDVLYGGDGDDVLIGDNPANTSGADEGDDWLYGGNGDDYLSGNGGNDYLYGETGSDTLIGGTGDDYLDGGTGEDYLLGGAGRDTLIGGAGDDQLQGGDGNDILNGGDGDDILYGDEGDDELTGGAGIDYLDGGAGNDTYVFNLGDSPAGPDFLFEGIDDTSGSNNLKFGAGISKDALVLQNVGGGYHLLSYSENDHIAIADGAISQASFADGSVLSWREVVGGKLGTVVNTTIYEAGANVMGGLSNDGIRSFGGSSIISGGKGNDFLMGGGGNNTYYFFLGDGTDTIDEIPNYNKIIFGEGITYESLVVSQILTSSNEYYLKVSYGDSNDEILIKNGLSGMISQYIFSDGTIITHDELLSGSGLASQLYGTDKNDSLFGDSTDNHIDGGFGSDTLNGGAGDDVLVGGADSDVLFGGIGNDLLYGGLGKDTLNGDDGNDTLIGNGGNDSLVGGEGDDVLDGGTGNDALRGGAGNDLYLFGRGYGQDIISNEGVYGVAQQDTIQMVGLNLDDLIFTRSGSELWIKIKDTNDYLRVVNYFTQDGYSLQGYAINNIQLANGGVISIEGIKEKVLIPTIGNDTLYGYATNDVISGGDGEDRLYGQGGNDTLNGNFGNDVIFGENGNDILYGNEGNDSLNGGDGNDVLDGGAGDDTLVGGNGNDVYIFGKGHGKDIIADWAPNQQDIVQLNNLNPADIKLVRDNSDLIIYINNSNDYLTVSGYFGNESFRIYKIMFENGSGWLHSDIVANAVIRQNNASYINGTTGDDTLAGTIINETFHGGSGNDTYIFEYGSGQDIISDLDITANKLDKVKVVGFNESDILLKRYDEDLWIINQSSPDTLKVTKHFLNDTEAGWQIDQIEFDNGVIWTQEIIKNKVQISSQYSEYIYGYQGNDTLYGGRGNDRIEGRNGDDILYGEDESDTLIGEGGNDQLFGGSGNDHLEGGDGDDILHGGKGDDVLNGGQGNDIYVFALGDGNDTIVGTDSDIDKIDSIQFININSNDVVLSSNGKNLIIKSKISHDLLTVNNQFSHENVGLLQINKLIFSDGIVWGSNTILSKVKEGDENDNNLFGFSKNDHIDGQDGDDVIMGGGGDDSLFGGNGDDTLEGGLGNNFMSGGSGADLLKGGKGNDIFDPGIGNDQIFDEDGDDIFIFGRGYGIDRISTHSYTPSQDVIKLRDLNQDDIDINRVGNDLVIEVIGLNDKLTIVNHFSQPGSVYVNENWAIHKIEFADETFWEGSTIGQYANNHSPTIGFEITNQVTVEDSYFTYTIPNDAFNDMDVGDVLNYDVKLVSGATLPSWLSFNAETLTLSGTPLNQDVADIKIKVTATDLLGASASQQFSLQVENSNDKPVVIGSIATQELIIGSSFTWSVPNNLFYDEDLDDSLAYIVTQSDGSPLQSWLTFNIQDLTLIGTPTIDDVGEISLLIVATDDSGESVSTTFNLSIAEGRQITGSVGDDLLLGSTGNDTLDGGVGDDAMVGGAGDDIYIVDSVGDVVEEYSDQGEDTIQTSISYILDNPNIENLTLIGTANINATGVAGNKEFHTITGNSGNNVIDGRGGLDMLDGGAGNDIYIVSKGYGNTLISDNSGNDVLQFGDGILPQRTKVFRDEQHIYLTQEDVNSVSALLEMSNANFTQIVGGAWVFAGGNYQIELVKFADGTVWTAQEIWSKANMPTMEADWLADNIRFGFPTSNDYLRGLSGDDIIETLDGHDILYGDEGNDRLRTVYGTSGRKVFFGGSGEDTITDGTQNGLLIGGEGNDLLTTGLGRDVISFNLGDGQDIVNASTGLDNTLSLGGDISYASLSFSKSGNNLILNVSGADSITFKDWYASTNNRSVTNLQVIAEAIEDFDASGSNTLLDNKIERFNFAGLVSQFDAARAADSNLTTWQLSNALLDFHLGGSDTAAFGGDLAYQYGLNGNLSGIGLLAAQNVISSTQFGQSAQTLNATNSWQAETVKLG